VPSLFHFSEDPAIDFFAPRPVHIPSARPTGMAWLNGPLVWAIDAWHQPMYLFPRDCPRILIWPVETTNAADQATFFSDTSARMLAYIEPPWQQALEDSYLFRYEMPGESFTSLNDAGMWVSRTTVIPLDRTEVTDLPIELHQQGVELRIVPALIDLVQVRQTTLHVSAIRLRNARQ
jgi:hypothetical protein